MIVKLMTPTLLPQLQILVKLTSQDSYEIYLHHMMIRTDTYIPTYHHRLINPILYKETVCP